ncbi:MAG: hypothetical protein MUP44_08800 [Anaerolineales bacterium]|nr:hypothetical protein [Anaerolineales bacterium]
MEAARILIATRINESTRKFPSRLGPLPLLPQLHVPLWARYHTIALKQQKRFHFGERRIMGHEPEKRERDGVTSAGMPEPHHWTPLVVHRREFPRHVMDHVLVGWRGIVPVDESELRYAALGWEEVGKKHGCLLRLILVPLPIAHADS